MAAESDNELDAKELAQMAALERQGRAVKCLNDINKVLEHYQCALSARVIIENNQTRTQIDVIAR